MGVGYLVWFTKTKTNENNGSRGVQLSNISTGSDKNFKEDSKEN